MISLIPRESLKQELFEEQQWFMEMINLGGGNWKCQTSGLMLLSKYKREPEASNKHVVLYYE